MIVFSRSPSQRYREFLFLAVNMEIDWLELLRILLWLQNCMWPLRFWPRHTSSVDVLVGKIRSVTISVAKYQRSLLSPQRRDLPGFLGEIKMKQKVPFDNLRDNHLGKWQSVLKNWSYSWMLWGRKEEKFRGCRSADHKSHLLLIQISGVNHRRRRRPCFSNFLS